MLKGKPNAEVKHANHYTTQVVNYQADKAMSQFTSCPTINYLKFTVCPEISDLKFYIICKIYFLPKNKSP
jgi:hypothetical protein